MARASIGKEQYEPWWFYWWQQARYNVECRSLQAGAIFPWASEIKNYKLTALHPMITHWDLNYLFCTGGNQDVLLSGTSTGHICASSRFITSDGSSSNSYLTTEFGCLSSHSMMKIRARTASFSDSLVIGVDLAAGQQPGQHLEELCLSAGGCSEYSLLREYPSHS